MESTLQLEEIRKAQRELNDAFSFRRSINVDQESEAFSVEAGSAQANAAAAEAAGAAAAASTAAAAAATTTTTSAGDDSTTATTTTKKRKIRRRVKRRPPPTEEAAPPAVAPLTDTPVGPVQNNIPDELDMPSSEPASLSQPPMNTNTTATSSSYSAEELATIESEFDQYTDDAAATSRFQQQLSGQWNDHILDASADGSLEPVAWVMQQLAVLDAERTAAQQRLDDEYAERRQLESNYYEKKRKVLEQSMAETQAQAFAGVNSSSSDNSGSSDKSSKQVEETKI